MPNALVNRPSATDLLCEHCGYTLNGLPEGTNCPECGSPAADSAPSSRGLPAWEKPGAGSVPFLSTTFAVLFQPSRFYRSLATRRGRERSGWFALIHWLITSLLLGTAIYVHVSWFSYLSTWPRLGTLLNPSVIGIMMYSAAAYLTLAGTTRLAARLTTWEASYRGYRLPLPVVLRGLDYHSVHYLPVSLLGALTVIGWRWMLYRHWVDALSDATYLYVICGEVIAGAAYLFWTYWIGMRNMMFANA